MKVEMKMDFLTEKDHINRRIKERNYNFEIDIEDIEKMIKNISDQTAYLCEIPVTPLSASKVIAHGKIVSVGKTSADFEFECESNQKCDKLCELLKLSDVAIFSCGAAATFEPGEADPKSVILKDPLFVPSIYRFISSVSDEAKTALIHP